MTDKVKSVKIDQSYCIVVTISKEPTFKKFMRKATSSPTSRVLAADWL